MTTQEGKKKKKRNIHTQKKSKVLRSLFLTPFPFPALFFHPSPPQIPRIRPHSPPSIYAILSSSFLSLLFLSPLSPFSSFHSPWGATTSRVMVREGFAPIFHFLRWLPIPFHKLSHSLHYARRSRTGNLICSSV